MSGAGGEVVVEMCVMNEFVTHIILETIVTPLKTRLPTQCEQSRHVHRLRWHSKFLARWKNEQLELEMMTVTREVLIEFHFH